MKHLNAFFYTFKKESYIFPLCQISACSFPSLLQAAQMCGPGFCSHLCWGGEAGAGAVDLLAGYTHRAGPVAIRPWIKT